MHAIYKFSFRLVYMEPSDMSFITVNLTEMKSTPKWNFNNVPRSWCKRYESFLTGPMIYYTFFFFLRNTSDQAASMFLNFSVIWASMFLNCFLRKQNSHNCGINFLVNFSSAYRENSLDCSLYVLLVYCIHNFVRILFYIYSVLKYSRSTS